MKKHLLLLLLLLAAPAASQAQSLVQFGVKAGLLINTTDLKFNSPSLDYGYDNTSTKPGFEAGVMVRLNLPGSWLLQPEILYNRTTGSFPTDSDATGTDRLKTGSNWFDVPVLVGWKFAMFRIMAGPSFRFPVNDVLTRNGDRDRIRPRLDNFVMGFQAGFGLDIGRFTLDARYCGNFTPITDKGTVGNYNPDFRVKEKKFAFSLGYVLFRL